MPRAKDPFKLETQRRHCCVCVCDRGLLRHGNLDLQVARRVRQASEGVSEPASEPASQPKEPARKASQPNKPASLASQPASQSASRPVGQSANQSASQPASHPASGQGALRHGALQGTGDPALRRATDLKQLPARTCGVAVARAACARA